MQSRHRRALIFTGGRLGSWALKEIQPEDFLIGADRGALFLIQHHLRPHAAIGDFDSVTTEELDRIRFHSDTFLPCDAVLKNHSDTEIAFTHALDRHCSEIVLIGALGTRFDHSLANIQLLLRACTLQIPCKIIDEFNEIRLTDSHITVAKAEYTHVSLLPLTIEVSGVTLEGFQYPLQDATLTMGYSLSVSNILTAPIGHIRISSGLLLIIQSKD